MTQVRFIGSEIYRHSSYGQGHPLAIPRVSTVIDLCRALGWLPAASYIDSPRARPDQLARFHDPDYIAAVMAAEESQTVSAEAKARYNIGVNGNPVFAEIFSRPATACGASILAAELLSRDDSEAPRIVFSPAGGTHHGRRGQASGFCYFNDPVLAILTLLDRGAERVFYLDIDAHHGDGVQRALADERRVMTLSVHEAGRWPMRTGDAEHGLGSAADRGAGRAVNLPVPRGFDDAEMALVLAEAILPCLQAFDPQVVVLQSGADALADDPQSKLALSNQAYFRVVAVVKAVAPRLLVLGGGGYNPWSVARCWAGIWAQLCERPIPPRLPGQAEAVLRALSWRHRFGRKPPAHWFETLADRPQATEPRQGVRDLISVVMKDRA